MTATGQTPDWSGRLRAAGLRVTRSRLAVLDVVWRSPHQSAEVVADQVRGRLGRGSTQAVYDALNSLTDHRILRRFEPAGSVMRFEIFTPDNHHHLVCRTCGRVTDVPCAVGSMPCAVPRDTAGYQIDEAEVTYWGLCAECAASPHDSHAPTTRQVTA